MIQGLNPWELGSQLESLNIPDFTLAKFMVVSIVPPKGKEVKDGIVLHAIMTEFMDEKDVPVVTMEVKEGPSGHEISFPKGKKSLLATKYRGPKGTYKFWNSEKRSFYQISNSKLTPEYAISYLTESMPDWETFGEVEKDLLVSEYLEDMYMFGLSNDLALNDNKGENIVIPKVGMVTEFYRDFTPPAEGERYGRTLISKFFPKKGVPNLSGEFTEVPEEVALMVHSKYKERADVENTTSKDDLPF